MTPQEKKDAIVTAYMSGWDTMEMVAKQFGVTHQWVSHVLQEYHRNSMKNGEWNGYDLTTRARNVLNNMGIPDGDLEMIRASGPKFWLLAPNCGPKCIAEYEKLVGGWDA